MCMKKFTAMIFVLATIFALAVNASAAEVSSNEIRSNENVAEVVYDDYLQETVARGTNVPSSSNLWDFDDGEYEGGVTRIRTGVYTNYCFYPNSSGKLHVRTTLTRHIDVNNEYHDWKIIISVYDMAGQFVKESKVGDLHTDSMSHTDYFTFTGLDPNTKYCFFISVYGAVCQVSGDIIISDTYLI